MNKCPLLIIFLSFNTSALFAGGCPEIRDFQTEVRANPHGFYIESKILDSNSFWLYAEFEMAKVDNLGKNLIAMSLNRSWHPDEIKDGYSIYRLVLTKERYIFGTENLQTNTEYLIAFSIEAPEGCFHKYVVLNFMIRDKGSSISRPVDEANPSELIVSNSKYELVESMPSFN